VVELPAHGGKDLDEGGLRFQCKGVKKKGGNKKLKKEGWIRAIVTMAKVLRAIRGGRAGSRESGAARGPAICEIQRQKKEEKERKSGSDHCREEIGGGNVLFGIKKKEYLGTSI